MGIRKRRIQANFLKIDSEFKQMSVGFTELKSFSTNKLKEIHSSSKCYSVY